MDAEKMIESILKSLSPREEVVMRLSYGLYNGCSESPFKLGVMYSESDIAEGYKMPLARLEHIKAKATRKILHRVLSKDVLEKIIQSSKER